MAEPAVPNLSVSGGAQSVVQTSSVATKLGGWILEIVSEAVGTYLVVVAFAFFQF